MGMSAYRKEVDYLTYWCSLMNLELDYLKTVKMVVDFRRSPAPTAPLIMCDSLVNTVESYWFLRSISSQDHQLHHQEGLAEDVLPATAEEKKPAAANDGPVLHSHH